MAGGPPAWQRPTMDVQRPWTRRLRSATAAALLGTAIMAPFAGCGSRGPLDVDVITVVVEADASAGDGGIAPDDGGAPPVDGGADAGDGGGLGPLQCPVCLAQQCGPVVRQCLEDTGCRAALQCAVTTCLPRPGGDGGGLDTGCLFGCAGNDLGVAAQALRIVNCVTRTCGSDCGGLLSNLGDLGFGGN